MPYTLEKETAARCTWAHWLLTRVKYLSSRPSLIVRVFGEREREPVGGLRFEVENKGGRPTSLRPPVHVTSWVPEGPRIVRRKAVYDVREVDRELPPSKARVFTASARGLHHNCVLAWFRSFLFRTTTGHWTRAHVRHALLDPLSPWPYWELVLFLTFGRLNAGATSMTIDKVIEDRRSRGPD